MHFTVEQHLAASPAEVVAAYTDPGLYPTLTDHSKIGTPEVLDITRTGDDVHVQLRMRFIAEVSSAVSAVIDPKKISWIQSEHYDLTRLTATVEFKPDHYADRFSCSGGYSFRDDPANPGGTLRVIEGDLKIRVMLVGGQAERAMVSGLTEHFAEEQPLVNQWLATH